MILSTHGNRQAVLVFLIGFLIHACLFWTEKAALLSSDDEVQKSDISSSSQGLLEKEALGPMLLEVKSKHTHTHTHTFIHRHTHQLSKQALIFFRFSSSIFRPSMVFSSSSTERAASCLFPRT